MEKSLEGQYYPLLRKTYMMVDLEKLRGIEYIPRMLELLQTPLSEEEAISILGMIGQRLHKFYDLFEWEFINDVTRAQLKSKIIEFLGTVPYRWPEQPRVICDETNNDPGIIPQLSDKNIWVDVWFKVNMRTWLYHIQMSTNQINCNIIDPYNVKSGVEEY
jgi:hypothetical protein